MEIAILDSKRPYDKEELKKVILRLLELRPIPSFVMTCYNKKACEVMKEIKKENSNLSYFIFNWRKDFDKEYSKHYIHIGKCDKYPDGVLIYLFNEHFMENSDLLIRQDKERIAVYHHPYQTDYIATLTNP